MITDGRRTAVPATGPHAEHKMQPLPVEAAGQTHQAAHQGIHLTQFVQLGTGNNQVVQLLGRDYDRTEAQVLAVDEPVWLAATREAAEAALGSATAGVPQAGASWLPTGFDRPILNGDELWAAATSATATRISVIVNRRLVRPHPGA
jgi:hypothetical protein